MSAHGRELKLPDRLLRNTNFLLIWLGFGIAALGDHLSEMALLTERGGMGRPDVTRIQALMIFGFFLPYVFIGPIAGWWSDRFSRKATMVTADIVRALIVFNLAAIVTYFEGIFEPRGLGDFAIILPLIFVGTFAAFFSPARQAMLPTLIRDDQLVRANSLVSAIGTIGGIFSAVLGGILVKNLGPSKLHVNYHLNALTFAISAILISSIAMSRSRAVRHAPQAGLWTPITEGFRYVRTHHRMLQLILLGAVFWGAGGLITSMIPALVRDIFHGDIQQVGFYRGLLVVGMAVGAAVMSIIGPALPIRLAVMSGLIGLAMWTLALLLCHIIGLGAIVSAICLIGLGGAGAALQVTIYASMQRFIPDARRGRVFGVENVVTMAAMVGTTGLVGIPNIPNLDRYVPWILLAIALVFVATALIAFYEYRRRDPITGIKSTLIQIIRFLARFWWGMQRDGICTIPRTGPVIVAANHTAGIDPLLILATSPGRIVSFLVAEEHYRKWGWNWFMRQAECIPVDRKNPGKSFLEGCLRVLKDGRCLGIFPQGTFEEPDKPRPPAKSGVAALALRTGATVIPVHISGTKYFDDPVASLFARQKVRIRYGKPVDLSAFIGRERDKSAPDEVAAIIMQKIWELAPHAEPT